MNRLLNDREQEMDEMLAGYLAAYPDRFEQLPGFRVLLKKGL